MPTICVIPTLQHIGTRVTQFWRFVGELESLLASLEIGGVSAKPKATEFLYPWERWVM